MTSELDTLKAKLLKLDEDNGSSFEELKKEMPGLSIDTTNLYMATLIEAIKDLLGEIKSVKMEIKFQEGVKKALDDAWVHVKASKEEQKQRKQLTVVERPSRLFGPDGKLIK